MEKMKEQASLRETFQVHRRGFHEMKRYCPGLFLSAGLNRAVSAVIPCVTIFFSAQIINELAGQRRAEELWHWVLVTVAAEAAFGLLRAVLSRWEKAKYQTLNYIERIFVHKNLSMDYADADKQETQDMRSQIDQSRIWHGWGFNKIYHRYMDLVQAVIGIVGAVALAVSLFASPVPDTAGSLVVLNHPAFLAGLVLMMAAVTVIGPLASNRMTAKRAALAEEARLGNRIFGAFGFMSADQTLGMDYRMYEQQKIAEHYMNTVNNFGVGSKMAKLAAGSDGVLLSAATAVSSLFTGMVYVFVCLKAWAGAFGVGSVTQYVGAVTALSKSMSLLIGAVGGLRSNTPFMRNIFAYLDIPNAMYQGSLTTEKRADRRYEVEFRDVSFKYPGSELWALRHVNMKFQVGRRLAVVGENGSGKTTFIKLLCRLYDPQEGQILLNGIDIRKYNYRDYMEVFSVVFQDFQLLSQPLGANVAGSAEYDREQVRKCLIDAGFSERLETMPDGLDTVLYKDFDGKGVDVSGGEAQKIAIARALYKDAPFIILDEPTAALDPIAEAEIYSRFNEIAGDKTAIYISHRLSSCKFCDEIAVFHEGKVIQQGTHEELVAEETGKYHELWFAQAQYYA